MPQAAFLTPCILEHIRDRNLWKVRSPLTYYSAKLDKTITVPDGFVTNLASIPRIAWIVIPTDDRHIIDASVVHDYLYSGLDPQAAEFTRPHSDLVLREACKVLGAPLWYREAVYHAVRLFGGLAWRHDHAKLEK